MIRDHTRSVARRLSRTLGRRALIMRRWMWLFRPVRLVGPRRLAMFARIPSTAARIECLLGWWRDRGFGGASNIPASGADVGDVLVLAMGGRFARVWRRRAGVGARAEEDQRGYGKPKGL